MLIIELLTINWDGHVFQTMLCYIMIQRNSPFFTCLKIIYFPDTTDENASSLKDWREHPILTNPNIALDLGENVSER